MVSFRLAKNEQKFKKNPRILIWGEKEVFTEMSSFSPRISFFYCHHIFVFSLFFWSFSLFVSSFPHFFMTSLVVRCPAQQQLIGQESEDQTLNIRCKNSFIAQTYRIEFEITHTSHMKQYRIDFTNMRMRNTQ